MFATFDQLASFDNDGKNESAEMQNPLTSSVDISAIINRLNDLEQKINTVIARNAAAEQQQAEQTTAERTETNNESEVENNAN